MSEVRARASTTFRLGDTGEAVLEIRSRLVRLGVLEPDHEDRRETWAFPQQTVETRTTALRTPVKPFDEHVDRAVRAFQQQRGLTVDGVVGPATYRVLDEARWQLGDRLLTHAPGNPLSGDDVVALQKRLLDLGFTVGRVDGLFGHETELGVREFQRNIGIPPDGTCGPATLKALGRLAPLVKGGQPNAMRAEERIRRAGPHLTGKIVVIDPAASQISDPDLTRRAGEITHDLARRVEGRLVATGVQAFLTNRGGAETRTQAERAEFANRTDAHLSVSLHVDSSPNAGASGVSTYFYGLDSHGVRSSAGERFAGLVQREIVARTDLADLRIHTKTWDFLRRTRMPAVRIDVGYITNPGDAARLEDPSFRDVIAEAVVVAVQRVYLSPETDPETGVLRLSELRAALRPNEAGHHS